MATEQSVLAVLRAARPSFRHKFDKVAFAVHAAFVAAGYALHATGPSAFADEALSSSATDEVGIENWNDVEDNYAFVYSNPEKGSKKVLVKCLAMNDKLLVDVLKEGGSEPWHLEIDVDEYVQNNGGANYGSQFKSLGKLVTNINKEILDKINGVTALISSNPPSSSERVPRYDNPGIEVDDPFMSSQHPGYLVPPIPGAGGSDLFPGPGAGMYPSGRGDFGGGSMLVGRYIVLMIRDFLEVGPVDLDFLEILRVYRLGPALIRMARLACQGLSQADSRGVSLSCDFLPQIYPNSRRLNLDRFTSSGVGEAGPTVAATAWLVPDTGLSLLWLCLVDSADWLKTVGGWDSRSFSLEWSPVACRFLGASLPKSWCGDILRCGGVGMAVVNGWGGAPVACDGAAGVGYVAASCPFSLALLRLGRSPTPPSSLVVAGALGVCRLGVAQLPVPSVGGRSPRGLVRGREFGFCIGLIAVSGVVPWLGAEL
ncbi:proteasome inhibitor-related [Striga asiatica]|uniref:Proteasome inhibitor-related n=1 Tax=Striga asiatica TaxID=4170 RepID=A0A5A7R495_STRAF|nr:proteasome inhibitor-related [Striga asiatica]